VKADYSMKWLLDKTMSILALVELSPIFITVMIILKLTGEHLVFYLPDRMGVWYVEIRYYGQQ